MKFLPKFHWAIQKMRWAIAHLPPPLLVAPLSNGGFR